MDIAMFLDFDHLDPRSSSYFEASDLRPPRDHYDLPVCPAPNAFRLEDSPWSSAPAQHLYPLQASDRSVPEQRVPPVPHNEASYASYLNLGSPKSSAWSQRPRDGRDLGFSFTLEPLMTFNDPVARPSVHADEAPPMTVRLSDLSPPLQPFFDPDSTSTAIHGGLTHVHSSRTNGLSSLDGHSDKINLMRSVSLAQPWQTPQRQSQYVMPAPTPSIRVTTIPATEAQHPSQRLRRSSSLDSFPSCDGFFENMSGAEDDGGSEEYTPSRSPSVDFLRRDYPSPPDKPSSSRPVRPRKPKRLPKKSKGSAALALAVVTQLGEARRIAEQDPDQDVDDCQYDPVKVYQETTSSGASMRKRKNEPIPLPVPVPNLNKKSRGRKVPFVANPEEITPSPWEVNQSMFKMEDQTDDEYHPRSSRTKRRKVAPPVALEDGLERSYVCVVAGCGKCFVRGEHLKRHVRSIHTHDRPFVCPYDGCDKSFSRRDNLGQHVRIHLNS